jgi:hypothetical protein
LESPKAKRKWYFDTRTGLLLAKIFPNRDDYGDVQINYFDYRLVDGIKVPFIQRVFDMTHIQIFKLTGVRHNVRIEDRKFNPPRNHKGFEFELLPRVMPAESLNPPSSKQPQEPKN